MMLLLAKEDQVRRLAIGPKRLVLAQPSRRPFSRNYRTVVILLMAHRSDRTSGDPLIHTSLAC